MNCTRNDRQVNSKSILQIWPLLKKVEFLERRLGACGPKKYISRCDVKFYAFHFILAFLCQALYVKMATSEGGAYTLLCQCLRYVPRQLFSQYMPGNLSLIESENYRC